MKDLLLIVLLFFIMIGSLYDLVVDQAHGASGLHLTVEALTFTVAALVFTPTLGALVGKAHEIQYDAALREGFYLKTVRLAIRHPVMTSLIAFGLLIAVPVAYGTLGKGVEFFPDVEPDVGVVLVHARGNLSIAENLVWIPWKIVTTPIVGAVQGTYGWYEVTGEPISGTLTAPVGTAFGLVTGAYNAFGLEPMLVERDDNLFEVMGNPFRTDQEIYRWTTPPHAYPRYSDPDSKDMR